MPLKWEWGKPSPYACNRFSALKVGPNTKRPQIEGVTSEIKRLLTAGKAVCCACGHTLDDHEVSKAKADLLEPRPYAEELLLVHPQPENDQRKKIKDILAELAKQAALPSERMVLQLRHPLAVFWFLPEPDPAVIPPPSLSELGLPEAGSPEDLTLDIIFDS